MVTLEVSVGVVFRLFLRTEKTRATKGWIPLINMRAADRCECSTEDGQTPRVLTKDTHKGNLKGPTADRNAASEVCER